MTSLLLIALAAVLARDPSLPEAAASLPSSITENATIVFSGVYEESASPHIPRANGVLERYLLKGFRVQHVYRGKVGTTYIGISELAHRNDGLVPDQFDKNGTYLVFLRPGPKLQSVVETGAGSRYIENVAGDEEVLAVVADAENSARDEERRSAE